MHAIHVSARRALRRIAIAPACAALAAAVAALPGSAQSAGHVHRAASSTDSVAAVERATRAETPRVLALDALRVEAAIRVDGALDEAAWAGAMVADGFLQRQPDDGAPATQRTEVRVLYDAGALYIGARLYDTAPDSIEARLARRDTRVHSDAFLVYLDSYHDRRSAFAFGVNAAGVKRDYRIYDETRIDGSWDAVWEAAVRRDARGWAVELRIPFSQLRFNAGGDGGEAAWGVNFERFLARRNETSHWAHVPRDVSAFVSRFGELRGLAGIRPGRRIELTPYVVARATRAPGDAADPYHEPLAGFGSAGADLKMGLTSGLTLSATLNPDFGQVEADPAVVNLTAFEIFQQERRPFFVEGQELFRLNIPSWPPVFYSRRIGRAPHGRVPANAVFHDMPGAATILGAVKLSGKTAGGWTIGVVEAVTAEERARYVDAVGVEDDDVVEPLTNYAAARIARAFRGGRTEIGGLVTATNRRLDGTPLARLPSAAYSAALDARHRFAGDAWEARAGVIASHVRGDTAAIAALQRSPGHYFQRPYAEHRTYDPARRSLSGFAVNARVAKISGAWRVSQWFEANSPGLELADLGFNPRLDFIEEGSRLAYRDVTPGERLRTWSVDAGRMSMHTFGGERIELTADLGLGAQLLNYWGGRVWLMRHQPGWEPDALRGGPALRKPGRWMGSLDLYSDARPPVSGSGFFFWAVEDETGATQLDVSASLTARPSDRLSIRLGPSLRLRRNAWQYVTRRTVDGEPVYLLGDIERTTLALAARLEYTFTPDLGFQLYARPFIAAGHYTAFREVVNPGARRFADRFRTYTAAEITTEVGDDGRRTYAIDRDGDGGADITLRDPGFNRQSLQFNAVLRWEYRPGSTLFAVWTHDRSGFGPDAFDLGRDLGRLGDARGRNVFLVKASVWVGL